MNLSDLSIRRPVFITSAVILMLVAGIIFMSRLPVDLFPNVTFPVVVVSVPYRGAGPAEVETLIAKPLENEISTISGIKRLSANAQEGVGTVIAEFNLDIDIKYAENQVRDAVTRAKPDMPDDIEEPIIRRVDPADQPILVLSLAAEGIEEGALFDLADEVIRPKLEQVNQVGLIDIYGGRKREVHVTLDRNKLRAHEISATQVSDRIKASGENVPLGKSKDDKAELVFRSLGEFKSLDDIKKVVVNFFGNDVPVTVSDVGKVEDNLVDETSRTFVNGKKSLFIIAYKQSGSNTLAVVGSLKKRVEQINSDLKKQNIKGEISMVRDGSTWIRNNVIDVTETIIIGIILAVFVVYLFLGSGRSTFITSLALPNSLIGGFILMSLAGFSINIMTLLALSLAVGLLIDDAIVVRENIFRHLEMGKSPIQAAIEGTGEVRLAVIATTFTIIAVFGPVGFLQGVVGQFFKEFGLTVCFTMIISLFDALTMAPMLSAYMATKADHTKNINPGFIKRFVLNPFDRFQTKLEDIYEHSLKRVVRRPLATLGISFLIFAASLYTVGFVTKTFLPPQESGEFMVGLTMPPGTSLERMTVVSQEIDEIIRKNPEINSTALTVGNKDGESNVAQFFVTLVGPKQRDKNTSQTKDMIREQLKPYAYAIPTVKDYDAVGGGQRPFNVNITGVDQKELEKLGLKLQEKLVKYPGLKDVDINFRPGKPELQVRFDQVKQQAMGISTIVTGSELRTQVDGSTPAKYRENDREFDIRVRLQEDQRDLKKDYDQTYIPNINGRLIPLNRVAEPVLTDGPSKVTRQNRARYVQINGDVAPGAGFADILKDVERMLTMDEDTKLPPGYDFVFVGQAENFQELGQNMAMAMLLGIIFIYFVLASLYESFITPFTIMLALPLAICGSFFALAITHQSLNIFSWIGVIMLLGVSTKNSILLVDYTKKLIENGMSETEALIKAGRVRLRPILMTTIALVAGTIPLAIGLNEASAQRTSMGIAIIGGLVSSTLLTLVVIPAAYIYIEKFRVWSLGLVRAFFQPMDLDEETHPVTNGHAKKAKDLEI